MNIGLFDLDGSLADYESAMVKQLELIKSPNEKDYDIWDDEPFLKNRRDLISSQPGFWENLAPIEMGLQILHLSYGIGFTNNILTKGPKNKTIAWSEKIRWCQNFLPSDVEIHIVSDNRKGNETSLYGKSLVYGKFLYDDFPPYMEAWLTARPRGIGIMPVNSHNIDYNHPRCIKWDGTNYSQIKQSLQQCYERVT